MDDILITDNRRHMPTAMTTSIKALYVVLGRGNKYERISPISMDKFTVRKCSWEKQQLGLVINTRIITVIILEDKLLRLVTTLNTTRHIHRKYVTLLEGVILLENIEHAASVYPWGRYL